MVNIAQKVEINQGTAQRSHQPVRLELKPGPTQRCRQDLLVEGVDCA